MGAHRTVNASLGASGIFGTEHRRLLGYLDRRREGAEARGLGEVYPEAVRAVAATTWRLRMINEHRSSGVFAALQRQLIEASTPFAVQTVTLRMALDEIHHAGLCGALVEAFGEAPSAEAEPTLAALPRHGDVSPLDRAVRNVMFIGCLAETAAVALVSNERSLATEPLVRATLDQILGDEISHARFGWQFVSDAAPSLSVTEREGINRWLRLAFGALEASELAFLPVWADPSRELRETREAVGLCEADDARAIFYETVETVVVPRLEAMGFDAQRAYAGRLRESRREGEMAVSSSG
ncbi:MAG: ferritin-like domain-containing protein [Myxococcales bacterium]|nr:ferritin-like domain-containing protein [Myxococcales bacterium]